MGTFLPPLAPFKLKLSGTTAAGQPFQRISRQFITAKNVLLRRQGGPIYKTLECGRTLRLSFVLHYNGRRGDSFEVTVNSSLTIANTSTTAIRARYRRILKTTLRSPEAFFLVWLKTPKDVSGIRDKWDTIKVTVTKISEGGDPGDEIEPLVTQADMTSSTHHFKVTCGS